MTKLDQQKLKKILSTGYRKASEPIDIDKVFEIAEKLNELEEQNKRAELFEYEHGH